MFWGLFTLGAAGVSAARQANQSRYLKKIYYDLPNGDQYYCDASSQKYLRSNGHKIRYELIDNCIYDQTAGCVIWSEVEESQNIGKKKAKEDNDIAYVGKHRRFNGNCLIELETNKAIGKICSFTEYSFDEEKLETTYKHHYQKFYSVPLYPEGAYKDSRSNPYDVDWNGGIEISEKEFNSFKKVMRESHKCPMCQCDERADADCQIRDRMLSYLGEVDGRYYMRRISGKIEFEEYDEIYKRIELKRKEVEEWYEQRTQNTN